MYRLLEWAFAYDDGSGLPDAGAYAAELKNVTATADGKPVQGFDPTKTGTWTIPAGTQVNIVDMPDDWKLDGKAEQPAGTVVFTASKYGTPVVTWTFKNDSATDPDKPADPGTDALKNVAATADGKPIAGFAPTRDGAYKVAAGAKVRISDVPSDWKLDKTESGSKLVFTASKGGTAVTWTFEYQANGGSSATDPGNGGGSNAGGDGQGDPGKTPDTSKPAASPKPAGTADDGQAAGAAPLASTGAGTGPAIAVAGLLAMAGASCSRPWPAPAAMARTLTVSRPTDEAILRPAHAPAEALYDNSGTVWASWTSSSAPHPSAFSRPASRPATAFRCACAPCYFLIPGCTNLDRSRPATA